MKAVRWQVGLLVLIWGLYYCPCFFAQASEPAEPAKESKTASPPNSKPAGAPPTGDVPGAKPVPPAAAPAPKEKSTNSSPAPVKTSKTTPPADQTDPTISSAAPSASGQPPEAPITTPVPSVAPQATPESPSGPAAPVKPSSDKPSNSSQGPGKSARPSKPSRATRSTTAPSKTLNGNSPTGKAPQTSEPPVDTVLPTYVSKTEPDLDWMETISGEIVTVNAAAQRILIRDERTHRTKLINFNGDTVFKKGEETVQPSALRLGTHLTAKYDFLDSTAHLITLSDSQPPNGK